MIEFTTGIALMASLYISGSPAVHIAKSPIMKIDGLITSSSTQIISSKQVEQYVKEQFRDEPILIDIARCESTYRQFDVNGDIIRGKVNAKDVGVMQINERYHAEDSVKLGFNIYTTEGNVAFAKNLYKKYGSQPWSSSEKCWGSSDALAMR